VNDSFSVTSNKWTTLLSYAAGQPIWAGGAVANWQLYWSGGGSDSVSFQGSVYNNVQIYQP